MIRTFATASLDACVPVRTSQPRGCVSAHEPVFFVVVAFGVAFDDIVRTFIHDNEMRVHT